MWEMQVLICGIWTSIGAPRDGECKPPPYRYDDKADAERMLERLYPDVASENKRVQRV